MTITRFAATTALAGALALTATLGSTAPSTSYAVAAGQQTAPVAADRAAASSRLITGRLGFALPQLLLSRRSGTPGTLVTILGTGLPVTDATAHLSVRLVADIGGRPAASIALTTSTTAWLAHLNIPRAARPGQYTVTVTCTSGCGAQRHPYPPHPFDVLATSTRNPARS